MKSIKPLKIQYMKTENGRTETKGKNDEIGEEVQKLSSEERTMGKASTNKQREGSVV